MLTIRQRPWIVRVVRELFYGTVHPFRKLLWFLFRPHRPGAKTFVFNQGKILLVRLGYAHKRWVLPGGSIDRGEEPRQAAIREVKEESGIEVVDPVYMGTRNYTNEYKKVTVYYYVTEVTVDDLTIDGQEIVDAGWFKVDSLPPHVATRVPKEIKMYNEWKLKRQL